MNDYARMLKELRDNGSLSVLSHNIDAFCSDFYHATGVLVRSEVDNSNIYTIKEDK